MDCGNWGEADFNINDYCGFVYLIEHLPTNLKYIGQKKFWFKKTLPPLKGKKNKRHSIVESDWRAYTSSSNKINSLIKKSSISDFSFNILKLCKSKWELNYYELKEQVDRGVLLSNEYLNDCINIRQGRPPKELLNEKV